MAVIQNFDDAEKIFHHGFYNELSVAPEEHPIFIIAPPIITAVEREKLTQIMFETFSVPALYIGNSAVLSLIASGKTSGVVVDCGHRRTYVSLIQESKMYENNTLNVGGASISSRLCKLLNDNSKITDPRFDTDLLNEIKCTACYVAKNYDIESQLPSSQLEYRYELPDGSDIMLDKERFLAPEILFTPSLDGSSDQSGLIDMSIETLQHLDSEYSPSVVLAGGSTCFKGFPERFRQDLHSACSKSKFKDIQPSVVALEGRSRLSWVGGSIMSSLVSFQSEWMSKDEYDEEGPPLSKVFTQF